VYAVAVASWLYLAAVLIAWAFLAAADRWWLATLFMYSPRWLLGGPLVILIPAAVLTRPRLLAVSIPALLLLIGPVMGLCLPWRTAFHAKNRALALRVLSCNIHYGQLDPEILRAFVVENQLDIVFLQGCPTKPLEFRGLEDLHARQDNELVIVSRFPFRHVKVIGERSAGCKGAVARYDIDTAGGVVHLFSLHLATPRDGLSGILADRLEAISEVKANSERRRLQSEAICKEIAQVDGAILIAGDFNTPTQSAIFKEYWSEYTNAFSTAGWGWGHTYFTRWAAVRIDHILSGPGWSCRRCWVGPAVGSPHRPVIAELDWAGGRE